LGIGIQVTKGYNQIQREVGKYQSLYMVPGSRITDSYMQLGVGETYNSNPGETSGILIVSTNGPLVFNATRVAGGTLQVAVNNLYVIDDPLESYSLTNNGSGVAIVKINAVNYTSLAPMDPVYYGGAVAGTINATFVQALAHAVNTGKDQTVSMSATTGQSLFYAYPLIDGLSDFSINTVPGGFTLAATVTLDVPSGATQYYVYQSTATGLGTVSVIVTDA
jgi:hypothetical protein